MAAYSSILAWRIPWTEEPDGLQSLGSQTDTTEVTQQQQQQQLVSGVQQSESVIHIHISTLP